MATNWICSTDRLSCLEIFKNKIFVLLENLDLLLDPISYRLYQYLMCRLNSDQFHSNQRMSMVHKNRNFYSKKKYELNRTEKSDDCYIIQ
jgi:hypothetical protein